PEEEIVSREKPGDAFFVERREDGPLIAVPGAGKEGEKTGAADTAAPQGAPPAPPQKGPRGPRAPPTSEKHEIGDINYRIEQARLDGRKLDLLAQKDPGRDLSAERARVEKAAADEKALFQKKTEELAALMEKVAVTTVTFRTAGGQEKEIRALDLYRAYPANRLSFFGRLAVYPGRLWEFLSADPRESDPH